MSGRAARKGSAPVMPKGAQYMSLKRVRVEQTDLLMRAVLEINSVDEGYALF